MAKDPKGETNGDPVLQEQKKKEEQAEKARPTEDCPDCVGRGQVAGFSACRCGGDGVVTKEEKTEKRPAAGYGTGSGSRWYGKPGTWRGGPISRFIVRVRERWRSREVRDGRRSASKRPGRPGNPDHRRDVRRNNEPNQLRPMKIGNRVPDGVGRPGRAVTIRGVTIDPGPGRRVIVESERLRRDGIPVSEGRAQLRDIRAANPTATIVVTGHANPSAPPIVYGVGWQPPPPGRLAAGTAWRAPSGKGILWLDSSR